MGRSHGLPLDASLSNGPRVPKLEPWDRDFIRTGRSPIEGTGVFAKRPIHRGARIIEYTGERVPADRLLAPDAPEARIYTFRLDERVVIDGARGGNDSRFINHSCAPNCEAYAFDGRLFIYAQADIAPGDELTFDYKLGLAEGEPGEGADKLTCLCGTDKCCGTMLRIGRGD